MKLYSKNIAITFIVLEIFLAVKNTSLNISQKISNFNEKVIANFQSTLDETTEPWGVKVERVEVKDVRLPHQASEHSSGLLTLLKLRTDMQASRLHTQS